MPAKKKRKHPKLPNGFGSIVHLTGDRVNQYAVYPPADKFGKRGKALCYVSDYYVGVAVLNSYKAGTYSPGDEVAMTSNKVLPDYVYDDFLKRMFRDYSIIQEGKTNLIKQKISFSEVYEEWFNWKFSQKEYSHQSIINYKYSFRLCENLHDMPIEIITYDDLQEVIDETVSEKAPTTAKLVHMLLKQMFNYAMRFDYIIKDATVNLTIPEHIVEHKKPLPLPVLQHMLDHTDVEIVKYMMIMTFSGMRFSEMKVTTVDLDNLSFTGGLKTPSGKDRIIPIHSEIIPIVKELTKDGKLQVMTYQKTLDEMGDYVRDLLGLSEDDDRYTTHCCRHTFSSLCEHFEIPIADQKRMMGHKLQDITTDTYGHRTLRELRGQIEKINVQEIRDGLL